MIFKSGLAANKALVFHTSLTVGSIPCGIQIVILALQLHNIPCVGTAIASAGNDTAVNALLQQQTVQQHRIALANRGLVVQGSISRIFQIIGFVFQIGVIISNVGAHPVIDGAKGLIVREAIQFQAVQQIFHRSIHPSFLFCSGIIRNSKIDGILIGLATGIIAAASRHFTSLPHQVVTFCAHSGMIQSLIPDNVDHCLKRQTGIRFIQNGCGSLAFFHSLPQLCRCCCRVLQILPCPIRHNRQRRRFCFNSPNPLIRIHGSGNQHSFRHPQSRLSNNNLESFRSRGKAGQHYAQCQQEKHQFFQGLLHKIASVRIKTMICVLRCTFVYTA